MKGEKFRQIAAEGKGIMETKPPPAYWLTLLHIQDDKGMRGNQSCGESCRLRRYPESIEQ